MEEDLSRIQLRWKIYLWTVFSLYLIMMYDLLTLNFGTDQWGSVIIGKALFYIDGGHCQLYNLPSLFESLLMVSIIVTVFALSQTDLRLGKVQLSSWIYLITITMLHVFVLWSQRYVSRKLLEDHSRLIRQSVEYVIFGLLITGPLFLLFKYTAKAKSVGITSPVIVVSIFIAIIAQFVLLNPICA